MNGKRYPEEFKIEVIKHVADRFPAWRHVSELSPTVFIPG